MNLRCLSILVLLVGLSCGVQAKDTPLMLTPGTGDYVSPGGVTVGNLFQVGANPLTLTALGWFDGPTPGLAQSHSVGLWTTGGTLLGRVDLNPGEGFAQEGYVYKNLATPVVLQPSTRYILGASSVSGTTDGCYVNDMIQYGVWSSDVKFLAGRYTGPDAGFTFPLWQVGGLAYSGANALYAVPEPSTLGLLLVSATAYGLWRVRRKA